jgi:hypothetical protein
MLKKLLANARLESTVQLYICTHCTVQLNTWQPHLEGAEEAAGLARLDLDAVAGQVEPLHCAHSVEC